MKKRIVLYISILLLSSLACSFVSQFVEGDTPVEAPIPAVEAEPAQPEPVQPEPDQPEQNTNILFQDFFFDPSSGWDRNEDEDGLLDYDNGSYHIRIDVPELIVWANPGLAEELPSDLRIDVDATKIGGTDNNDFGVICRYSWEGEQPNFYYFLLSSDGYTAIVLVENGSQTIISAEDELMAYSDEINQGDATNHITAECIGNQLKLLANGAEIASATDDTLTSGDVGLIASTYEEAGTDILFNDFIVTKP